MTAPALQLTDVSAAYGPFRAIFDVSLTVPASGAVALLGANGAGKTTVARVASGLVKPTSGTVAVGDVDLTGKRTFRFARAGVAHAPEGRSVFATLTVEENLSLAFRRSFGRAKLDEGLEHAYGIFPQLAARRDQPAGNLSGGEQRMLSLARPLVEKPAVLIADELSLGLAPIIVNQVYDMLARVREAGTALLIVEQHVGHALALCDHAVLLMHGAIEWEGPAADARDIVTTHLFESGSTR